MGKVAALLGRPFMPWQQQVADVAFEVDPVTRRLVYREVVLTVPRQSGKTTLEMATFVHRGLATRQFGPRQRMVYTAQKRKAARKKWEEDFLPDLELARGLRGKWSARRGAGNEGFDFSNGSTWGLEAAGETSGHGSVLDLAFIDEAFAQPDGRLEQAFKPAMMTRAQPQRWVVSTMGWQDEMPYLWPKIERGRERAEAGFTDSTCYFEWSAPDEADPTDPATWRDCMPALGHTQTEETIASDLATAESVEDFRRAYLNQVVPKPLPKVPGALDAEQWRSLAAEPTPLVKPAFGVDLDETGIGWFAVAWRRPDGVPHVQLAGQTTATKLQERSDDLTKKHRGRMFAGGPSLKLLTKAEAVSMDEFAAACARLEDMLTKGTVRHSDEPELNSAVESVMWRTINAQGARAWQLRNAAGVGPIAAVSRALHGLVNAKPRELVVVY